jgi:regulator of nonsense transcripts 1
MSTTMFSAREALIPGSAYDRSKSMVPGPFTYTTNAEFINPHDTLSYIDPRSRAYNSLNVPIPVPMLMPPVHHQIPNAFFTNNTNSQLTHNSK